MFFCKKLLFALYLCSYSSSIHRHSVILLCNNLNICTYENHGGLPNLMLAIFLAPLYILINIYIVRWMILWMGACTHLFQTPLFRVCFAGVYIFLASSLLTSFLIRKPPAFHRFLKNTANLFSGHFSLYSDHHCHNRSDKTAPETYAASRLALHPESFRAHRSNLHISYYWHQCLWNFKSVES